MPATPQQVQAQIEAFNKRYPGQQTAFNKIPKGLQAGISGTMGIPQSAWDDPNSYHAKVLRSQMGYANLTNPKNTLFENSVNQFRQAANNPQRLSELYANIGWDPQAKKWMEHERDVRSDQSQQPAKQINRPLYFSQGNQYQPTTQKPQPQMQAQAPAQRPQQPVPQPMNRPQPFSTPAASPASMPASQPGGNSVTNFYRNQQDQEIARMRDMANAVGKATGQSGSGTYKGKVFPDGKGGYRVENPSFTPISPTGQGTGPSFNPNPVPATGPKFKPVNKQGSAMTEKQLFKLAFISKCIEDGLTLEEMGLRVKQALYFAEKRAEGGWLKTITDAVGDTVGLAKNVLVDKPLTGLAIAGGVPLVLGYYGAGPAIYNTISKPNLPSREELMAQELANEYELQTKQLKQQAEMAKRRKERSKGISGVTRF